jgi:hypothetical protein
MGVRSDGISTALAWNSYTIRSNARWFARSHRYKAEVLAQPSVNGQLKHVDWDGRGGVAVGDWTVYLVFDPTDSLSVASCSSVRSRVLPFGFYCPF